MNEIWSLLQVFFIACVCGLTSCTVYVLWVLCQAIRSLPENKSMDRVGIVRASAAPAIISPAALPIEKPTKEKPGRSCGHCGARIKSDPVKAMIVEEESYLVFACPVCKKRTLIQEPTS